MGGDVGLLGCVGGEWLSQWMKRWRENKKVCLDGWREVIPLVEKIQRKQIGLLGWVEMGYPDALQWLKG